MQEPLFWSSPIVFLSAGLLTAHMVNVLLVRFGAESGAGDPREAAQR